MDASDDLTTIPAPPGRAVPGWYPQRTAGRAVLVCQLRYWDGTTWTSATGRCLFGQSATVALQALLVLDVVIKLVLHAPTSVAGWVLWSTFGCATVAVPWWYRRRVRRRLDATLATLAVDGRSAVAAS